MDYLIMIFRWLDTGTNDLGVLLILLITLLVTMITLFIDETKNSN